MYLKILAISFAIVALQHVGRLIFFCGFHKTIYNHSPGPCTEVHGIDSGSEDISILPDGLALISSGYKDSLVAIFDKPKHLLYRQGKILAYHLHNRTLVELKINGLDLDEFSPHGIDVWTAEGGEITVFVVNHPPAGETVEIFDFNRDDNVLDHRETIRHSAFTCLNSVLATGRNSFFATNFHGTTHKIMRQLHFFMMLPFGNIVHYDGDSTVISEAATGFFTPNGIAMSNDGQYVYLNVFQELKVLKIVGHRLTPVKSIQLHSNPDNVYVDKETGDLYLGCIPKMHDMGEYLKDTSVQSAGHVLRVQFDDKMNAVVTEIFSDDGRLISGLTMGARQKNHLLIGTVHTNMLHCEVRIP